MAEHSEIAGGIRLMYCHFITISLTLIVEEKRHQTRYVGPTVYLSRFVIGVWKPTSLIFYIFPFYPDDCPFQDENSGRVLCEWERMMQAAANFDTSLRTNIVQQIFHPFLIQISLFVSFS